MNTLTATAESWLDNGIAVIPVAYRDKRPSLHSWREFQTRLPTLAEIRQWFQSRLNNIAIVTGWRGLVVLDFDQRPAYELWRDWSREAAPKARFSYTVETARGIHVYLFVDEPTPTARAGTIDIKAMGGYVLAPPSIHPSGRPYRLLSDAPILRVDTLAAVLPPGLLALAQPVNAPRPPRALPQADPWRAAINPVAPTGDGPIAAIKAQHNLFELFPQATRRGDKYWARCPIHDDRNPSVSIRDDGSYARCWAGCLEGDILDWYMALHNVPLAAAIEALEAQP